MKRVKYYYWTRSNHPHNPYGEKPIGTDSNQSLAIRFCAEFQEWERTCGIPANVPLTKSDVEHWLSSIGYEPLPERLKVML